MRASYIPCTIFFFALLPSCNGPTQGGQETEITRPAANLSVVPTILDDHRVELVIETTLPLPVTVATSISLKGQEPLDTYIGYDGERVELLEPSTTVVLDTSGSRMPLPKAQYLAEATFYPRWGAEGNPEAEESPELNASVEITLVGDGGTVEAAVLRDQRRAWIFESLDMNTPWNEGQFEQRLGASQKMPSDMSPLHDAYYYPGADVTLIVNRVRNNVTIWRLGKETR